MKNRKLKNLGAVVRAEEDNKTLLAERALAAAKVRKCSLRSAVEAGLAGDLTGPGCARWIAMRIVRMRREPAATSAFARLMRHLAACRSSVLDDEKTIHAVSRVARLATQHGSFIREPEAFHPRKSKDPRKQFLLLLRHLFCRYPMPDVFDEAWFEPFPTHGLLCRWWLHLASGKSLRTAEGLPLVLTRRAAHEILHAPVDGWSAVCFGRFVALGVSTSLATAASRSALSSPAHLSDPYWDGFARFLAAEPTFPPEQVGAVVDFVLRRDDVGAGSRRMCFRGRSVRSVLRAIEGWHRQTLRWRQYAHLKPWRPSGFPPLDRTEGSGAERRRFRVVELISARELVDEGSAMRHCVASYAYRCAERGCAIFSMTEESEGRLQRLLTIEVNLALRQVVQARGRANSQPGPVASRILRMWSVQAGVPIGRT